MGKGTELSQYQESGERMLNLTKAEREQLVDELAQLFTEAVDIGDLMAFYKEKLEEDLGQLSDGKLVKEYLAYCHELPFDAEGVGA
jgi:hypothetical protein